MMHPKELTTKTIENSLFVLRYNNDTTIHKYDLLISNDKIGDLPFIPNETELCILFYDKVYQAADLDFEINECLMYHYNACDDPQRFLSVVKKACIRQHLDYPATAYEDHIHNMAIAWFDKMENDSDHSIENMPKNISHKVLLLHELGIIQDLRTRYFSNLQNERKETDFARLIAVIINEPKSVETIRKSISSIGTGNDNDPATPPGIKKVKAILSEYSINFKGV